MTLEILHLTAVEAIRAKLHNGHFTERELARMAGISQTHCHHVLAGKRSPTTAIVDKLLAAAKIDIAGLLAGLLLK